MQALLQNRYNCVTLIYIRLHSTAKYSGLAIARGWLWRHTRLNFVTSSLSPKICEEITCLHPSFC